MADFITRLAERALGVAPVVQPVTHPVFAPEPTGYPMDLEWDGETPASSGELDRAKSSPAMETLISEPEEQGANAHITPPHPSATPDVSPEPRRPAEPGSPEHGITPAQEDQRNPPPATSGPDPTRRDEAVSTSRRVLPEDSSSGPPPAGDFPDRATSRPTRTLVERGRDATVPSETVGSEARAEASSTGETLPARDAPAGRPEDGAIDRQEDRSNIAPATAGSPRRTPDEPEPYRPAEPGLPERGAVPAQEDQRNPPPATSGPPRTPDELEQEARSNTAPATSKQHQRTPDTRPAPPRPDEPRISELGATLGQEDQSILTLTTPNHPQRMPGTSGPGSLEPGVTSGQQDPSRATTSPSRVPPETRPEMLHRAGSAHRDPSSTSRQVLPENVPFGSLPAEDESGRAVFRPVRTLVDPVRGATPPPAPSPGARASGDKLEPGATPDRSGSPAVVPVAPRVVRPRLDDYPERGPREPRAAAPEPSVPEIRVAIGRIEVRAVTPPPPMPPVQLTTPERTGPALSLDDYLKQRNGGWR